jgi:hypothetical protein
MDTACYRCRDSALRIPLPLDRPLADRRGKPVGSAISIWSRPPRSPSEPTITVQSSSASYKPALDLGTARRWYSSHGPDATKWKKSPEMVTLNCSTTAQSRSHLPFIMAMKPSSGRNERFPQQPARYILGQTEFFLTFHKTCNHNTCRDPAIEI